jgi:chromosome segregation ATPase
LIDFALRFGLALTVVIAACAAVIISRRNYAKSADSERNVEAFRLEFQRSIDAAQAATIKTLRDNIFSVIKTINSTMRDLSVRLTRLEERTDEAVTHIAGAQNLDVRIARLEQHADAAATYSENLAARLGRLEHHADASPTATENLVARLTRLEERADETATHIAGTQNSDARLARLEASADETAIHIDGTKKQSVEQNEQIAVRLEGFEQNLVALNNQLSAIKQAIDGTTIREQDVNFRVISTQKRLDELFPRLVFGEKALNDLGTLISLFVRRLKKLNASSTETAPRPGEPESRVRSKARQHEEHHSSLLERNNGSSTSNTDDHDDAAISRTADRAVSIEAETDGENTGLSPGEVSSKEAEVISQSNAVPAVVQDRAAE